MVIILKIRTIIKTFLCTAFVTFTLAPPAFAANKGVVTGDIVNIRSGCGTDNKIITQVYRGNEYNIIKNHGEWSEIEYAGGMKGFIHNDFFKPVEEKGTVTGSYVNIRKEASTNSEILGLAYRGDTYTAVEDCGEWVKIKYNGSEAWIYGDYFKIGNFPTINYNEVTANNVLAEAGKYNGFPYVYGAAGPNAFDCSGFTQYVFKKFGVNLPRTATSQASVGYPIAKSDLKPGDLVFFQNGGYIDHVGIYVGNGQMIHAASSRSGVRYASISCSYFGPRYAGARRVI